MYLTKNSCLFLFILIIFVSFATTTEVEDVYDDYDDESNEENIAQLAFKRPVAKVATKQLTSLTVSRVCNNEPNCYECGQFDSAPNVKIVGGIEATRNSWPSMAFIKFDYKFDAITSSNQKIVESINDGCVGTLIDQTTVLTAAQCIQREFFSYNQNEFLQVVPNNYHKTVETAYKVYLGFHDLDSIIQGTLSGNTVEVEVSSLHESQFNELKNLNDIAIIKLAKPVQFNKFIQPACLPHSKTKVYPTKNNLESYAIGFNTFGLVPKPMKQSSPNTINLNNVKLTIYDGYSCKRVLPFFPKNWLKQICAGELAGGKSVCHGDPGVPLFVKDNVNGKEKFVLTGVTSYGFGCGIKNLPAVFTRVSYYMNWIQDLMDNSPDNGKTESNAILTTSQTTASTITSSPTTTTSKTTTKTTKPSETSKSTTTPKTSKKSDSSTTASSNTATTPSSSTSKASTTTKTTKTSETSKSTTTKTSTKKSEASSTTKSATTISTTSSSSTTASSTIRQALRSKNIKNKSNSDMVCDNGATNSNCYECGQFFIAPNVRIVGGKEAIRHGWPSMAFVHFNYTFDSIDPKTKKSRLEVSSSLCGGTLLDRKTVITAAHCILKEVFSSNDDSSYKVTANKYHKKAEHAYKLYFGVHDINNVLKHTPTNITVGIEADSIHVHEGYSTESALNDIAIIKLSRPVEFNRFIQPACLPNPKINIYPVKENITSYAAGWGTLSSGGDLPETLQNVKLTVYNESFCESVGFGMEKNWTTQICSGELEGGKDTCQGDSGGPLFVKDIVNGRQKFVLAGLTSYGDGCGGVGLPGIYTRVSAYMSWIKNLMEKK
ncbi:unnamed protein product [Brachionus calyciflorus]|uniref:Peptidase S1 domain-containing protein n=1 Tax=Brachionus calyciflorus TaxID=104777 RepID=A0A814I9A1_9BILA|nr:unnamed protein product [Brachionus calyciflorus]